MKVFISWSGEKSKAVAELLNWWLQCVLQAIDPWMSSKDIDRGSLWFSEITDQLKDTCTGIVCLTKYNKDKPWILFESGALAKGLTSSRVCTLLIDLDPSDIKDPLAQFNHTLPTTEGLWGLVRTLNACLGEKALKEAILEKVFETYWPQFEEVFENINKSIVDENGQQAEKRSSDEILNEILSITRALDKRVRSLESKKDSLISVERKAILLQEKDPYALKVLDEIHKSIRRGVALEEIERRYPNLTKEVFERIVSLYYEKTCLEELNHIHTASE